MPNEISHDGIFLINKPEGQTSFQSLAEIKRRLSTKKVGHAGTLDKFAEGLLIVFSGRMTRLAQLASGMDKEYIASITFGKGTDTLDPEGTIVAEGPIPERGAVESILPLFRGTISQVPPAYSAVHIGGRRAYQAARAGEDVAIQPREVSIHGISLVEYEAPTAVLRVQCSKGTYIRSLARDIAERLGTCSYVSRLRRTRIGGFVVEEAKSPDVFDPDTDFLSPKRFFDASPSLASLVLRDNRAQDAAHGRPIDDRAFEEVPSGNGVFGAFTLDGRLVALVERRTEAWHYIAVFFGENASCG